MPIKAQDVKALRDATGAGMMAAKKALTSTDGDMEAARQLLREQGLAQASARSGRRNDQGAIAAACDGRNAAVVMLKCETDFSAKNPDFIGLTQTLADAVLANGTSAIDDHSSRIEDLRIILKENVEVGTVEHLTSAAGNLVDVYVHNQSGRGVNAVAVEGSGVDAEALHQVSLHIAFAKPQFLRISDVPAQEVEKERAALLEITKAEGKPEASWDKIVNGRLHGWYRQRVLLEQGLHGGKPAVKKSIGKGSIVRFVQVTIAT